MTENEILFRCGRAEVYEEDGTYYDLHSMNVVIDYYQHGVGLIAFDGDTDTGLIDGEPLDILLQCLEHRLATRNLADPVLERTNALDCLRNMRRWLAELETRQTADRERSAP